MRNSGKKNAIWKLDPAALSDLWKWSQNVGTWLQCRWPQSPSFPFFPSSLHCYRVAVAGRSVYPRVGKIQARLSKLSSIRSVMFKIINAVGQAQSWNQSWTPTPTGIVTKAQVVFRAAPSVQFTIQLDKFNIQLKSTQIKIDFKSAPDMKAAAKIAPQRETQHHLSIQPIERKEKKKQKRNCKRPVCANNMHCFKQST